MWHTHTHHQLESSKIVHCNAINFIYTYHNISGNTFIMPVDEEGGEKCYPKKQNCKRCTCACGKVVQHTVFGLNAENDRWQ